MTMRPKRSLGQNFLVDPNYQRKIVDAVSSDYSGECVIEIGPGKGALTRRLLEFADKLVLVEKDRELGRALVEEFASNPRVGVAITDFLEWDLSALGEGQNIVVANLPYNVSTQILLKLLKNMRQFKRLVLMFQKEVALRCVAEPGGRDFGILAAWCQLLSKPVRLFDVPPTAFRPQPKVTSSVVSFTPSGVPFDAEQDAFMAFVKRLFSQRRKKVGTLLKPEVSRLGLSESPLKPLLESRAEVLSLEQMRDLYETVKVPESR